MSEEEGARERERGGGIVHVFFVSAVLCCAVEPRIKNAYSSMHTTRTHTTTHTHTHTHTHTVTHTYLRPQADFLSYTVQWDYAGERHLIHTGL